MTAITPEAPSKKDYSSDQTVRWCPGCGDYSILAQTQKTLPDLGVPRENIVFISGIGCSSRFPYYMNTYGIHSIHGRAPAVATGLKLANPDLKVFIITGDGDGLSIGGNHLIHLFRRNLDVTVILFNNQIYGLTKGQYSPTSKTGTKTKSSPMGSFESPFNPISLALASGATFVARSVDNNTRHLAEMLSAGARHKGTAFIEVLQNCPVFNDGVWEHVRDVKQRTENALFLENGKPLIWGPDGHRRGIRREGDEFSVVTLENGDHSGVLTHTADSRNIMHATGLAHLLYPEFPVLMGVLREVEAPVFEVESASQIRTAQAQKGRGDLAEIYNDSETWEVTARA